MFSTLLESRASRSRSVASMITSVGAHGVLLAVAVALTMTARANATVGPVERQSVTEYILKPAPVNVTRSKRSDRSSHSTTELRRPSTVVVDVTIPGTLPPVDLVLGNAAPAEPTIGAGLPGIPVAGIVGAGGSLSVAREVIGERDVDRAPQMIGSAVQPRYPESLRAAGITGRVVVQFVVDTTGRAEPGSLEVQESPRPEFADAVRAALPRFRFTPGDVNGRRVRTRVQLPFEFSLSR